MSFEETGVPNFNDPMGAVLQYVDAFNNGDPKAVAAACANPMQILDGMSPHVWQGPTAAEDWWTDVLTEGEHLGASGYRITLGEPPAMSGISPRHLRYEVLRPSYVVYFKTMGNAEGLRCQLPPGMLDAALQPQQGAEHFGPQRFLQKLRCAGGPRLVDCCLSPCIKTHG